MIWKTWFENFGLKNMFLKNMIPSWNFQHYDLQNMMPTLWSEKHDSKIMIWKKLFKIIAKKHAFKNYDKHERWS